MTNHKAIIKIAFPLILFFLASCEGNTDREWKVSNESSTTIFVRAGVVSESDTIYESIETHETKIITITGEPKGNSLPQQAYDVFLHFMVTNTNGDTANIDFADNDNWDIYIERTKSNPPHFEHSYDMIITNQDFN